MPFREVLGNIFIRDRGHNDAVLALLPVRRRGDLVMCRELERIENSEDLIKVSTS